MAPTFYESIFLDNSGKLNLMEAVFGEKGEGAVFEKIISGGQTGVDRAALDVALDLGLPRGGWCPKGRRAEDGPIPARYPLKETGAAQYPVRTEWNIRDSDGTLVLAYGPARGGTALTLKLARRHKKPLLVIDLRQNGFAGTVREWGEKNRIKILNVAGPRESEAPGIYGLACQFLREVLVPGKESQI